MPAVSLILALVLLAPSQQVPPDTTQPAADTQAVVLPVADTSRLSPLPTPPADDVPNVRVPPLRQAQLPPPQEAAPAPPDTTTPAPADTQRAALPGVPPDTAATAPTPRRTGPLRSEWDRVQETLSVQLTQFRRTFSLTRLLLGLLALALTYIIVQVVIWLLERLARWRPAYAYSIRRMVPLVKFGLWFVAAWIVIGSLFAGSTLVLILLVVLVAGAVMVAGVQFLRDLAGGLVLTFEQPFQLGSRVEMGPHRGQVRKIGLRAFELTAPDGATVVIPNAEVLKQSVTARPPNVREAPVTVELVVPAGTAPDTARRLVREAAYASPYVAAARPVRVTLLPAEEQELHVRVEATVYDAVHAEALKSDVVRLTHDAFASPADDEPLDAA